MNGYTEMSKIIQHAMSGNTKAVESYARLLADNLKKAGEERGARMMLRALEPNNPEWQGAQVVLD